MSDVMFFGVLRMPYELVMSREVSRFQFWQRAQEAANRVEAQDALLQQALEALTYSLKATDSMGWTMSPVREACAAIRKHLGEA